MDLQMEIYTSLILTIVFVICLIFWIFYCKSTDNMPPGPTFFQTYTSISEELREYQYKGLVKIGRKYNGLFTMHIFGRKFIVINNWKVMQEALVGQSEIFSGRPEMYLANKLFQNTDILFIDGRLCKEKRRFTLHHFKNFVFGKSRTETIIMDEITRLMDIIDQHVDAKQKLQINGLLYFPMLNIIFGVIAGKQYDYEDKKMQEIGQVLKDMFHHCHSCIELNFAPWLRFIPFYGTCMRLALESYDKVKTFLNDEIDDHLQLKIDGEPRDFIDVFLKEIEKRKHGNNGNTADAWMSSCYDRNHLVGITFDLLQAGLESTISTLEWTLVYMALWPEIQMKIQYELDSVVGQNRQPSYTDHAFMPYLEATILEIHRFASVIPMSGPHSTLATTKLAGFTIPKRTTIFQNIWAVHNDPTLWGDPEVFRPERFINVNGQVEKPDYLIPFSLGARKCIGETLARVELFLFIACLLQRYTFSYAVGETPPSLKAKPLQIRGLETAHLVVKNRLQI